MLGHTPNDGVKILVASGRSTVRHEVWVAAPKLLLKTS